MGVALFILAEVSVEGEDGPVVAGRLRLELDVTCETQGEGKR